MIHARLLMIAAAIAGGPSVFAPMAAAADATGYWTATRLAAARPLARRVAGLSSKAHRPAAGSIVAMPHGRAASPPAIRDDELAAETLFPASTYRAGPASGQRADATVRKARGSLDWLPFSNRRVGSADTRRQWPYRTVGKLFATFPDIGDVTCTGAVVGMRLIATAAHCLYDQLSELNAVNVLFVPAFDRRGRNIIAPFGRWSAARLILPPAFLEPFDGAVHEADFALILVADRVLGGRSRQIGELTGALGWRTFAAAPAIIHQLGYPENLDRGLRLQETVAQTVSGLDFKDRTGERLNGLGALVTIHGGPQEDGSSGGPVVADLGLGAVGDSSVADNARNQILGVVSFGFNQIEYAGGFTTFNAAWQQLFRRACTQQAGNC